MLGHGRLADIQFLGDQQPANPVSDQIAIDLLAEMSARVFEPVEHLQAPLAGQGSENDRGVHFGNCLIPSFTPSSPRHASLLDITADRPRRDRRDRAANPPAYPAYADPPH